MHKTTGEEGRIESICLLRRPAGRRCAWPSPPACWPPSPRQAAASSGRPAPSRGGPRERAWPPPPTTPTGESSAARVPGRRRSCVLGRRRPRERAAPLVCWAAAARACVLRRPRERAAPLLRACWAAAALGLAGRRRERRGRGERGEHGGGLVDLGEDTVGRGEHAREKTRGLVWHQ